MQIEVVSVKFLHGGNSYYFSPNGLKLKVGDRVIVETEKGKDLVTVVKEEEKIEAESLTEPLKNVVKVATDEEVAKALENDKIASTYIDEVKKIVLASKLDMKVVSVEGNYNLSRITVNFTSENRVDFRDLVKKLAEKFKTKVDLRQIGPRDAARILGGLGPCGKECCCKQGIGSCDHVSIKMAKNQGLALNPNSISGLCGKLLCCLSYENAQYAEILKIMPKVNSVVKTPDGEGKVVYCDILQKRVDVKFSSETTSEIKTFDVKQLKYNKDNK